MDCEFNIDLLFYSIYPGLCLFHQHHPGGRLFWGCRMVGPATSQPFLEQNQIYSDLADRTVLSGWRAIGSNRGRFRTQPFGHIKISQGDCIFWAMNALALTRTMDFLIHLSQRLKISKIRNFIEVRTRSLINASPLNILSSIMITAGTLSAAYGNFQGLTHPEGIWSRIGVHGSLSNLMTYSVIIMLTASLVLARILFDSRTS